MRRYRLNDTDIPQLLATAHTMAAKYGATIEGDEATGYLQISGVEGRYTIEGEHLIVTVTHKPPFIPWSVVDNILTNYFGAEVIALPLVPVEILGPTETTPEARQAQAQDIIRSYTLYSAGSGLIPIPLADIAALTALQIAMTEQLTHLYGQQSSDQTIRNIVQALTSSTLAKLLARLGLSALKVIPGIGTVAGGVAMSLTAGASTYALGQVMARQCELKQKLDNIDMAEAQKAYDQAYDEGREVVTLLQEETTQPKVKPHETDSAPKEPPSDVVAMSAAQVLEAIESLSKLHEQGIISLEEFTEQKTKLLKRL